MGEGEEGSGSLMKTYRIEFLRSAAKSLKQLERIEQRRIQGAIELLKTDPIPPSAKRLKGRTDYSLRVGDFRVIYTFASGKLTILVIAIAHRREIYR